MPTTIVTKSGRTRRLPLHVDVEKVAGLDPDGRIVVDDFDARNPEKEGFNYTDWDGTVRESPPSMFGLTLCCNAYDKGVEGGVVCRKCRDDRDIGAYLYREPDGTFPGLDPVTTIRRGTTMHVTTHEQYRSLLDALSVGDHVGDETHASMVAFAKAKKIKRPPEDNPKPEPKAKAAKKTANKGAVCKEKDCDRPATSLGLCKKHHTAQWRKDPANLEKSRRAARKFAAKKRLEDLAVRIGPGFHGDTSGDDYESLPEGVTPERVDHIVNEANEYELDVNAVALDALAKAGLL